MLKTPMIQEILLPLRDKGWKLAELNVGQVAFYAQDDWNINDDFKLTLGLRADKPLYFNTLI
jgi:outer membrane receptor protein involved in Fe transport